MKNPLAVIVAAVAIAAGLYSCTTLGPKDLAPEVCADAAHSHCLHRGTTTLAAHR